MLAHYKDRILLFQLSERRKAGSHRWVWKHQHIYARHNFRIGAATTAAEKRVEDSLIQTLGRSQSSNAGSIDSETLSCACMHLGFFLLLSVEWGGGTAQSTVEPQLSDTSVI